ncbi:uncharacterized protein LOC142014309 isoform X2 [Carettochelys insculpta]|uniref:uncharacterized protein LOC142014309 isoform X2 n=1 Tax=Carettochelys insculpta TaxID=44489 RepID=UPI003EC06F8F
MDNTSQNVCTSIKARDHKVLRYLRSGLRARAHPPAETREERNQEDQGTHGLRRITCFLSPGSLPAKIRLRLREDCVTSWAGFTASHEHCERMGNPHTPTGRYGGRLSDGTVSTTRLALDGHPEIQDKNKPLWASVPKGIIGLSGAAGVHGALQTNQMTGFKYKDHAVYTKMKRQTCREGRAKSQKQAMLDGWWGGTESSLTTFGDFCNGWDSKSTARRQFENKKVFGRGHYEEVQHHHDPLQ